MESQHFVRR